MVRKADTRAYTGSGKNSPTSSGFTRVLVVGVTSFRERERISGLFGGGVCVVVLARCVSLVSVLVVLRCGPCLPFYSFQGRLGLHL
jgi:hypothetical protein